MSFRFPSAFLITAGVVTLFVGHSVAQSTTTQLFGPINVRPSQDGAGYGLSQVTFNTSTLDLTCTDTPTATLSSSASGTANLLVDNNINVTNLTTAGLPVNVCQYTNGVTDSTPTGPNADCFTTAYQGPASNGQLNGVNPDTIVATGGVHPIDISSLLTPNTHQQIKIDLVDQGGEVASSSLYLTTNCSFNGVKGGSIVTGNTIPPNNPSPAVLTQNFNFNTAPNNAIDFEYDLSTAQNANTLTINSAGSTPIVTDSALEPLADYPAKVAGTSFATSMCLVHSGELLTTGQAGCKLYTLQCTTGTGSDATGAQCPVSQAPNEILKDVFDGPGFTLPDLTNSNGTTFHQGVGFLMAAEGWTLGPCVFSSESQLQNLLCPQNLLTSFSGPGLYSGTGQTTHPNSTFISIAQVPEDLTSVSITDINGSPAPVNTGNWTNNPNPYVRFSSQPPNLIGTAARNVALFVPAPIQTITYGLSSGTTAPAVGSTGPSDTVLTNPTSCPLGAAPTSPLATTFTPAVQSLQVTGDGTYLIHYYATDCAGTEELKFLQDNTGSWSTNFYTYALNIDTVKPQVSSGPTPSANGPYYPGQAVTVSYSCSDDRSGIVTCGSTHYATPVLQTPVLTAVLPTSAGGAQTFTVQAVDAAGNTTSQTFNYSVSLDNQITFTAANKTLTYPFGTTVTVKVANTNGHVPTGTVKIMEGSNTLATLPLRSGTATYNLNALPVGTHNLYAAYSGDAYNPAGDSALLTLVVQPAPVKLVFACVPQIPFGTNQVCGVLATSDAGLAKGVVTYRYDNGSPVNVPLNFGVGIFSIPKPALGKHTVTASYAAQSNYASAPSQTITFNVKPR